MGPQNLVLEGHCPAEFSSSRNQTHLNNLIKVFIFTRRLQVGVFELKSAGQF